MQKVVITIDEMKPHWAEERGLKQEAESMGIKNVRVTGDFDSKITYIYGEVEDFDSATLKFIDSVFADLGSFNRSM